MDISEYKAGSYQQGYDYSYFVPSKINHAWLLSDPQVQQLLSEADRALGALSAFTEIVPDVDAVIRMHISKEATQSIRIENNAQINIEDLYLSDKDIAPEKRHDWNDVNNYILAINNAISRLETTPLNNRLLKDTHKTLMQGAKGERKLLGEFRLSQSVGDNSLKNASFGSPHHSLLVELMSDFEKFINNDDSLPSLIKIAIAHYQFETIRPFLNGNGRLGRLMITLYLAGFKLLPKPALYLSDYFATNKAEYTDRMMALRQSDDMKGWISFFLQGVLETSRHSSQMFKDVIALKSKLNDTFLCHFGLRRQANAQALMRHLYHSPIVTIKGVADLLQIKANTAAALIGDFESYGVLTLLTAKKRNRLYGFSEYIDIFAQKTEFELNVSNDYTQVDSRTSTQMDDQVDTPTDTLIDTPLDIQLNALDEVPANGQVETTLPDWKVKLLVTKLSGERSRAEIQSLLELKDAEHLRQGYIIPSLKLGYLDMTLPDKPSSKLQRYRLTTNGIILQHYLINPNSG